MDDLVPVITALTALVVAVGAFVLNYLKGQRAEKAAERAATASEAAIVAAAAAKLAAEESKAEVIKVGDKVYELGKAVDGRLSKLLALTESNALAQGRVEGVATEKAEQAERTAEGIEGGRRNGDSEPT